MGFATSDVDGAGKNWKKIIEGDALRQARDGVSEGEFTAIIYYIRNDVWRCSGYDLHSKSWRSLPPVSYLPPPDSELFKEYSVCGHGGLMCAEVSKLPKKGKLVVFNPLTGKSQALPPLLHPRNPVLVHILVDSANKVIVAGSSAASEEHLSRKVEVFDSSTSKWEEVSDLPGPAFGLNEHQAGVCLNGKLFFISFLEGGGRGVAALDVENGTWLQDLATPIPWSSSSDTLQLVESDGKLFLFSEQESVHPVDHRIDELAFQNPKAEGSTRRWRSFVKVKKSDAGSLQVDAGDTWVGLGIFNPLKPLTLLASYLAFLPKDAYAGDPSMDSLSGMWKPWESPDFGKAVAGTLLAGLVMVGAARVACGIFRRRQAPGHRFDIARVLEDGDRPGRREQLLQIPPAIP